MIERPVMKNFFLIAFILGTSFLVSCNKNKNSQLTVYVVRHAESFKNLKPLPDLPNEKLDSLTPTGVQQASEIGKALKNADIVAIYTSPTGRTKETGQIIGKTLASPKNITVSESLISLNNGKDEKGNANSFEWREAQWAKNLDPKPIDGETMQEGVGRSIKLISQNQKKHNGRAIVLVTHGDICAGILGEVDNTPYANRFKKYTIPTGTYKKLAIIENKWFIKND